MPGLDESVGFEVGARLGEAQAGRYLSSQIETVCVCVVGWLIQACRRIWSAVPQFAGDGVGEETAGYDRVLGCGDEPAGDVAGRKCRGRHSI